MQLHVSKVIIIYAEVFRRHRCKLRDVFLYALIIFYYTHELDICGNMSRMESECM